MKCVGRDRLRSDMCTASISSATNPQIHHHAHRLLIFPALQHPHPSLQLIDSHAGGTIPSSPGRKKCRNLRGYHFDKTSNRVRCHGTQMKTSSSAHLKSIAVGSAASAYKQRDKPWSICNLDLCRGFENNTITSTHSDRPFQKKNPLSLSRC